MGYFRDDTPLQELILDEKGVKELEPPVGRIRFHRRPHLAHLVQYYFNQSGEVEGNGAESGLPRPDGHEVTDPEVISGIRETYMPSADETVTNDPIAPAGHPRSHFERVNDTSRGLEKEHATPNRCTCRRC